MLADDARDFARDELLRRSGCGLRNLRASHPTPSCFPGVRRDPSRGVPAGDRAVHREPAQGRPQRPRAVDRELHVPQRAAGATLRRSGRVRQPLPARDAADAQRGGPLGQGSILMLTSYADRTSPVLRGKWLLENMFGAPPPPPPANVPPFRRPRRQASRLRRATRMEQHRHNPVCAAATCAIDPLGFALENFDAIGKWRDIGRGRRSTRRDAARRHAQFNSPRSSRKLAVSHSGDFVLTLTEKMLMYALGRGDRVLRHAPDSADRQGRESRRLGGRPSSSES